MPKLASATYKTVARLTLLSAFPAALTGCLQSNLAQHESQLAQLESEHQALDAKRTQLQTQQRELDARLALLETEKQQLVASRTAIEQERRKLEVLKKSIKASSQSDNSSGSIRSGVESDGIVVGQLENVVISPPGIKLSARIDTGAATSSLNAQNLMAFERDGKPYVRFNIIDPVKGEAIELIRRVRKHVRIKEHNAESKIRPVVRMRVILGNIDQRIQFTLTDRSNFEHQVLIGRNFLRDFAVVDVSRQFVTTPAAE